jgi:hypothetical protein
LWPWKNNIRNSQQIMNNSISSSWTWDNRWVVRVHPFFGCMVLVTTNLLLL